MLLVLHLLAGAATIFGFLEYKEDTRSVFNQAASIHAPSINADPHAADISRDRVDALARIVNAAAVARQVVRLGQDIHLLTSRVVSARC